MLKILAGATGGLHNAFIADKVSGCISYNYITVDDQTVKPQFTIEGIQPNTNCKAPFNGSVNMTITGHTWTV